MFIFISIIIILLPFISNAATLYVDGTLGGNCTGNYSITARACSGSDGNAYVLIQSAENASAAGDIIYIRAGTYEEQVEFTGNNGTEGSYITYQNYNNEVVICKWPTGNPVNVHFRLYSSSDENLAKWLRFSGLIFDGNLKGAQYAIGSQGDERGANFGITIDHCTIFNYYHAGIKGCWNWLIEDNIIYNIGHETQGDGRYDHAMYLTYLSQGIIRRNHIYDIQGYGLHIYAGAHGPYVIEKNYIERWGLDTETVSNDQTGIYCSGSTGIIIRNNLLNGNGEGDWGIRVISNATITGNYVVGTKSGDLVAGGVTTNTTVSGNIFGSSITCNGCTGDNAAWDDVPPNSTTKPNFFAIDYVGAPTMTMGVGGSHTFTLN